LITEKLTRIEQEVKFMAGYYIAEIDVHDEEAYEEYKILAMAAIQAHGGEAIVRGGAWESLEGAEPASRVVVLKFASVEAARNWFKSPEYEEAHAIRSRVATSRSFIVEGA